MTEEEKQKVYIEILQEWSPNPEDLKKLLRRFSPQDVIMLVETLGSPGDAVLFLTYSKKLVSEMLWRETLKEKMGRMAKAVTIALGIVIPLNAAFWYWVSTW